MINSFCIKPALGNYQISVRSEHVIFYEISFIFIVLLHFGYIKFVMFCFYFKESHIRIGRDTL